MKYKFSLFIVGNTSVSNRARKNIEALLEENLKGQFELVVIDILEDPESAEREKIIATPALLKHKPEPETIILGDFSNREALYEELIYDQSIQFQ